MEQSSQEAPQPELVKDRCGFGVFLFDVPHRFSAPYQISELKHGFPPHPPPPNAGANGARPTSERRSARFARYAVDKRRKVLRPESRPWRRTPGRGNPCKYCGTRSNRTCLSSCRCRGAAETPGQFSQISWQALLMEIARQRRQVAARINFTLIGNERHARAGQTTLGHRLHAIRVARAGSSPRRADEGRFPSSRAWSFPWGRSRAHWSHSEGSAIEAARRSAARRWRTTRK